MTEALSVDFRRWSAAYDEQRVIPPLTLRIEPGQRVLIAGPSGCGKTTLLMGMAGLLQGEAGPLEPEGTSWGNVASAEPEGSLLLSGQPPKQQTGSIAMVMQDPDAQIIFARAADEVAFGLEALLSDRDAIWQRVHKSLERVGLDPASACDQLSGGQKQRLALACAFAVRPGLMLLDEPTANLDAAGISEVTRTFSSIRNCTAVIVEHRLEHWLPLVDRVIILSQDGTVTWQGTPKQLPERRKILQAAGVFFPGQTLRPPPVSAAGGPTSAVLAPHTSHPESAQLADQPLLECRNLDIGHRNSPLGKHLSFTLEKGQCLAVTGANGSGKSTLLLTLAGALKPQQGQLKVKLSEPSGVADSNPAASSATASAVPASYTGAKNSAKPIHRWRPGQMRGRIGLVLQNPEHQFLAGTVKEEIMLSLRHRRTLASRVLSRFWPGAKAAVTPGSLADRQAAQSILRRLHLDHLQDHNPFTLSGGQKRRLSLALLLVSRPQILLLDEPTFGQDAHTTQEIVDLLGEVKSQGAALVLVTHDPHLVQALADKQLMMGSPPVRERPMMAVSYPKDVKRPPAERMESAVIRRQARVNPAIKLLGAFALTMGLLISLDPYRSAVYAVAALIISGFDRQRIKVLAAIVALAGFAFLTAAVYGQAEGNIYWQWGFFRVSDGSLAFALSLMVRFIALGLISLLTFYRLDLTVLADGLVQIYRLPYTVVFISLAAFRTASLLLKEWQLIKQAARLRGIKADAFPVITLLISALRRASRLAVSLEIRGVTKRPRTYARISRFTVFDLAWLFACAGVVIAAEVLPRLLD